MTKLRESDIGDQGLSEPAGTIFPGYCLELMRNPPELVYNVEEASFRDTTQEWTAAEKTKESAVWRLLQKAFRADYTDYDVEAKTYENGHVDDVAHGAEGIDDGSLRVVQNIGVAREIGAPFGLQKIALWERENRPPRHSGGDRRKNESWRRAAKEDCVVGRHTTIRGAAEHPRADVVLVSSLGPPLQEDIGQDPGDGQGGPSWVEETPARRFELRSGFSGLATAGGQLSDLGNSALCGSLR